MYGCTEQCFQRGLKGLWTLQQVLWKVTVKKKLISKSLNPHSGSLHLHWELFLSSSSRNPNILNPENLGCLCILLAGIVQAHLYYLYQKPKFMKHTHSSCFERPRKHYSSLHVLKPIVSRYSKTETKNSNFHNIPILQQIPSNVLSSDPRVKQNWQ